VRRFIFALATFSACLTFADAARRSKPSPWPDAAAPTAAEPYAAPPTPSPDSIDVAVTVDDLPRHGPEVPGLSRLAIAQAFVAAFRAHRLPPVYGFVNGGAVVARPSEDAVLDAWTRTGNPLGNHTWTHVDPRTTSLSAYLADIDANESLLRRYARAERAEDDRTWKVFRYPFLLEGADAASRAAIRRHLAAAAYRVAPVTIDFFDWAFVPPYARCLAKGDERSLALLEQRWLAEADTFLTWADRAARELFGRPIPHVLLLHAGALDAKMIDALLSLYERRGVRFVSLDAALDDPAYAAHAREIENANVLGGTALEQLQRARGRSGPEAPDHPLSWLVSLCP
jgi:peptidoglycan/xylan/chitin deacetylase (PgdA/CDA1 family)